MCCTELLPLPPPLPVLQGFYIPQADLTLWAAKHPEYSTAQVLALTACIAESCGMKKRDKAALLAQVEGQLRALGPMQ